MKIGPRIACNPCILIAVLISISLLFSLTIVTLRIYYRSIPTANDASQSILSIIRKVQNTAINEGAIRRLEAAACVMHLQNAYRRPTSVSWRDLIFSNPPIDGNGVEWTVAIEFCDHLIRNDSHPLPNMLNNYRFAIAHGGLSKGVNFLANELLILPDQLVAEVSKN